MSEGQTFWMEIYEALINQQDADVWASIENPNLIMRGGGEISLNTATDVLSWSGDIEIVSLLTGGKITIVASSLSGFVDGKIACINLSRPVSGESTATMQIADVLSTDRNKLFVALRNGSSLLVRNDANRQALTTINKWDTRKIVTSSVPSGGGIVSGSIPVGIVMGSAWRLRVTAIGNTTNTDIQFFADSGLTEKLYEALGEDCYSSPYDDGSSWFVGMLTDGLLYYKLTNNGANASVYHIELVGQGESQ